MLYNKNILIGITAGIAAYKILPLIRMLKKQRANVKTVVTNNALNFVTPLSLQTLTQNKVFFDEFNTSDFDIEHISLCQWADMFLIAPVTANSISKLAYGICDNLLTSIAIAFDPNKPIVIAPAMNNNMWNNEIIKKNIEILSKRKSYNILYPEKGPLACNVNGDGRLCNIENIFDFILKYFENKNTETNLTIDKNLYENDSYSLEGKRILITAGGTVENIDPVRYISNYSSGKMGIALADIASSLNASVELISTFDFKSDNYKVTIKKSALEMFEYIKNIKDNFNIIVMAAAVADYRPRQISLQKIKKNQENLTINLIKNPDILSYISANKSYDKQIIIGFCAESENLIDNAKLKISNKKCDYLIANDISRKDIGFSSSDNEVYIIDKNLNITKINKDSKINIAKKIWKYVCYENK